MLWDLLQQRQIGEAKQTASEAAGSARKVENQTAELSRTVESLTLSCQAMWELLRERSGLTDEMLMQRMQEIDLRDGKADGKMGLNTVNCPACSRPNHSRHERCLYCGTTLPPSQHVFAKR